MVRAELKHTAETAPIGCPELRVRRTIKITLPFGTIELRGYDALIVVVLVVLVGLVWVQFTHVAEAKEATREIIAWQAKQEQAIAEMIYVLTLSGEQRDRLKLAMPESLRRRMGQ